MSPIGWQRERRRSWSRKSVSLLAGILTMVAAGLVGESEMQQLGAQVAASGQEPAAPSPTFEVASVKPNKSGQPFVSLGIQPGGRFTATNVPLRLLIRNAYQIQDFQLVGAPDWISTDRFDIIAKAEGDVPPSAPGGPPGPIQLMLRALLTERFNLKMHSERRELPIYAMVLARNDGKLGPQLRPASVDCAGAQAAARRGGPPPTPPQPGERLPCGIRMGPGQLTVGSMPLSQLATLLAPSVGRVVVDRTGLSGNFDFDLTWTPDQIPQGPPPAGGPQLPPIDPNGPSILTAVQEQLGLKLDSTRGPVDVLVVDNVEKPTPD